MTYQEKYEELYKAYEVSTKQLLDATETIADINGFGDRSDLAKYFEAHNKHRYAEFEFHRLLHYMTDSKLDPATEYITQEYIYSVIKKDQQRRGVRWNDNKVVPEVKTDIQFYHCTIGLTNDGTIKKLGNGVEYKFPVLNLKHGKECYDYLAKMLQQGGGGDFDIEKIEFKNIDERNPLFLRVELDIR